MSVPYQERFVAPLIRPDHPRCAPSHDGLTLLVLQTWSRPCRTWYMEFTRSKANLAEAQRMLDVGKTVREVAESQGVSTQAVYGLLQRGSLKRPAPAG